jgi:acyl-CoA thioesterase
MLGIVSLLSDSGIENHILPAVQKGLDARRASIAECEPENIIKGIPDTGLRRYDKERIMDEKIREAIIRQVEKEPFTKKFNLKLIDLEEGYAKVAMVFTEDMENMFGMAHGGALFALIDESFEIASNSHGTMAVALSMNINYIATPAPGVRLTAEAKELNRTKKTAAYDIRVTDSQNNFIAVCQAVVYRKDKPLPFLGN